VEKKEVIIHQTTSRGVVSVAFFPLASIPPNKSLSSARILVETSLRVNFMHAQFDNSINIPATVREDFRTLLQKVLFNPFHSGERGIADAGVLPLRQCNWLPRLLNNNQKETW
jgi:hypothetical protein